MKQTNPQQLDKGVQELSRLQENRTTPIGAFHKKLANDPALMRAFTDSYIDCCVSDTTIPQKYRELFFMVAAAGTPMIAQNHAKQAQANGATMEEISEVLRIMLNVLGTASIIPLVNNIFEEVETDI